MQNDYHKRAAMQLYQSINKKAYPIISCKAEDALSKAFEYVNQSAIEPDITFFDLPGTANTKGVLTTLRTMDFIFSPISADRLVMESTLSFTKAFLGLPETAESNEDQKMWMFWNQVDGRERSPLYDVYNKLIDELGLSLMQCQIMNSTRFRKESEAGAKTVFRSTLMPPDERLMNACRLDQFMTEFLRIVQL